MPVITASKCAGCGEALSQMQMLLRALILTLAFAVLACAGAQGTRTRRLPETSDFNTTGGFHFTISPDDRWLVFFKRKSEDGVATSYSHLSNLRLLDLKTGGLRKFTLSEEQAPEGLEHGDASWAPDSSHCLLPPPLPIHWVPERGILIDVRDPAKIRVPSTQVKYGKDRAVEVTGEDYATLEQYTCSDCSPHINDVELMTKHVAAEHLHWGDVSINRNENAEQIVSFDGTKIYFQKGYRTDETILCELDIASGKERQLTSHKADCATIHRLRPSPDGEKLAYMFTTGCGFISVPKLYVLDLKTGETAHIADASGGTMHWTSDSHRLFFYRDDFLHVAEFGKASSPPTTAPATAPSTQPGTAPVKP